MTVGYDEEGDVRKLPKWAQRKIEILEMRLREARQRYEEVAAAAIHKSGAVTFGNEHLGNERALADHETVYFWVGPAFMDYVEVRHERDLGERAASVRAGAASMLINPRGANGIIVEPGDLPSFGARTKAILAARAKAKT